jgi:hypothetical protein
MRAVMCEWKSRPRASGGAGRHRPDAPEQLALAVVQVLGHHGAVQGEEDRVTAAPDRAHDGVGHVLVGRLLDVTRGMGACRDGDDHVRVRLLGHVEKAAELGVGVPELLDGLRSGEGAEGGERGGHGREGIRLVHHHGHHDLATGHALSPA